MSNLRAVCRPHMVFTSLMCSSRHHYLHQARSRTRVSFRNPDFRSSSFSPWLHLSRDLRRKEPWFRVNQRRTSVRASNWSDQKSPYETLELERDADEEQIKTSYRRLAKFYHPDVYDGKGTLEEGETAEARFIKIQAAYELLIDGERRRQYDMDNRVNPMKIDPDEERRILAKEKKASMEHFNSTLKRHTLVLKKRDLMRKKAEEEKKKVINQLLAAEGLELDADDESQ
ncbi:hypothetical protein ES332_D01G236100v1 [Gossypium tomentosum]|uniref:J domain-containing protein n=1 Tax=Gossypium tomentosum TaxID=34277 RepID=A0A5D2MD36_GOSTO|nr:hypothetical protein ES332_D01G236100v1 [Gossypium tomentosum]